MSAPGEERTRASKSCWTPPYGAAMTKQEPMVEGEPVRLILEALLPLLETSVTKDGMTRVKGPLVGDSGAALVHALGGSPLSWNAADMRSFLPAAVATDRTVGGAAR